MVNRRIGAAAALLFSGALASVGAQQNPPTPPQQLRVAIDTQQTARPVSPYEYGMFIEHIGALIYRSLWSEMLDDRKFYFPIKPEEPQAAAPAQGGPFRNMQLRKWHPIGPAEAVVMDKEHPFVGEQSPRIELDASSPHGIRQSGFTLVKGRKYTGHIWLRATLGAKMKIALVWGEGANDRQVVAVPPPSNIYKEASFNFVAGADTEAGAFEITGTGTGSFHVGAVSLMPADNVDGFRPEVIAQLKQLHSGFWRLPGGNFISDFNWYHSVGPRDKRPPNFDYAWNAMQTNDVGMDELMTFCKLIGVEPYITVNAGFGDAHSAAEEVEYMNGAATTHMGTARVRNGHPEPYHVRFWNVGNEPYGQWQLGRTDLKYYLMKHNEFAKAMREVDPSITLLASGSMPEEAILEGVAADWHIPFDQAGICSDADWTCGFLKHDWGNFDGITEHWYTRAGTHWDRERAEKGIKVGRLEAGLVPDDETNLDWVRRPSDRVRLKAEEWQEYEKQFPEMKTKQIFMSNDEYAYTGGQTDLKLALAYAMVLNEMLRETDFLRMTAFTMGVSTLDFNQTAATLNTNGLLFKLYGELLGSGSIPVALTGNSPQSVPTQHMIGDLPRTSAGSPTYPLDMFAALSADRKFLTLAVVNATDFEQRLDLSVNGLRLSGNAKLWRMTGKTLDAANKVGQPPQVEVKESAVSGAPSTLAVAPISVEIFRFPVGQ
ncbi:alpha-L-arabinofuranosidase C-terminal domain-containing protein [Occallatibacter riparius]|uniref:non-reducing end alpha-L-arabinofuranosidase n=1 Tax=Occallatibacter riparius TaxID=1002689 RepID=A0A9J7BKX6_9BACT|nr:alpha-L-arabinofuranosidase C-terminal domain-containing protein [Occallatibacter riparius]UWZ81909.1 alpha-N-arabinofuranosidase [Occallatibacter riparius]